jgi:hypothetical protein
MTRTRGGWVARDDHIRSGIACYYGARSANGIRPHGHSGADKDSCGNPTTFLNPNRFRDEVEGGLFKIVRTSAKKSPLGQAHIGGDGDAVEREYQNLLANPDMVPDLQAPWEGYIHAGPYHNALSDFCSESSQHRDSKGRRQWKPTLKKQRAS